MPMFQQWRVPGHLSPLVTVRVMSVLAPEHFVQDSINLPPPEKEESHPICLFAQNHNSILTPSHSRICIFILFYIIFNIFSQNIYT